MKLIEKVTIKYFRSLHTVELKDCSDVNVISGRNDVGKSNIIKALNLFFNGQVDWENEYAFYENFSIKRLEEVRQESIKGKQFISIKVEFNRPKSYQGSLPERFSVERKWLRDSKVYEQTNNLGSLGKAKLLPSSLTTAQRSLATFLNKIHFEYIPAVRDRAYVSELLGRLQRTLLDVTITENSKLRSTAETLAKHIEGQIGGLQSDFEEATRLKTSITPPSSVSSLFQSFYVSTTTDNGPIPLKFRGDGLQSRYIASVLHYIASSSSNFFIWGYEEPEIALEYNHANQMAKDFREKYSTSVQIFLTTHSPAFIALDGDQIRCYRVSQDKSGSIVSDASLNTPMSEKDKLKNELGIIAIQKEVHNFYSGKLAELDSLSRHVRELEAEVLTKQCPLIVTEGITDKLILEKAAKEILENHRSILIRACDNTQMNGGNGGATQLSRLIETIHPDDERIVIAVFDNDEEGQKGFNNLSKNFTNSKLSDEIKKHVNGYAWAMLLPEPNFREGYVAAKNLCIEYMFPDEVLNRQFINGRRLRLKRLEPVVMVGGKKLSMPLHLNDSTLKPYMKIESGKEQFAEQVVPKLRRKSFQAFEKMFDDIIRIVSR